MISLNWVKDYINLDNVDLKQLAVEITKAGVNIEKVITNHIDGLVIGEVKECVMHPNSDHLHVCKVDIKDEVLQIVCGAPNVREGLKVIVATDGTKLPDGVIKKGSIRGVESNGMLCALFELGLEEKNDETYSKGIYELSCDAKVGDDPLKYLGLDDTLYEVDIHKHRNNDCYYHIGFAYEIGTILNKKVVLPDSSYKVCKEKTKDNFSLEIDTKKCPLFIAKLVKDVKIKESPDFIKKRLVSAGMRSINNVVDISNYIMLEYGQPMHFYDYDNLGSKIVVRDAKENEEITTLDGKNRILTQNDIVITDGVKPVCIAGVMGGVNTEVENTTKNILIEGAIFDAISIRNTANRLNLKSEASIRYGKGLNYEYTYEAVNRACHLLEKYADATICDGEVIIDNVDKTSKVVTFKSEEVNKLLGITISTNDMEIELNRLGFEYKLSGDTFTVTIPNRRLDIDPNVNDIAEEIGRLYGYHNLKSTLPVVPIKKGVYVGDVKYRKEVSKRLRSLGLNEAKTYTLVSKEMASMFKYRNIENVLLPNPMSADKSVVRTTLIPSLLNVYNYNKARKVDNILLYEISKVYDKDFNEDILVTMLLKGNYIENTWSHNNIKVDYYVVKGILESVLDYLGLKNRYSYEVSNIVDMHPGVSAKVLLDRKEIGIIGRVHPNISKDDIYVCEISLKALMTKVKPIKYKEANKYPSVVKDLAFVVDKDTSSLTIYNQIKKSGGRLVTNIEVFDIYDMDNEKSIAYKLTFEDPTRTLNEEEVLEVFNKIIKDVSSSLNAKLRG